ncbi:MAG: hypothetical protein II336_12625 [Loktanella sp.]|nr:hypothetical protein [Loktanella sp.]
MRFLPPEAEVKLYDTVFDSDILDRKKVSKSLSALLDRIEDPLVIALDGRWGTGKSYFLQRWVGAHAKQNSGKALTLYFDAFANDYLSDPLVALVAALAERVPHQDQPKMQQLKKVATSFIKPLVKIGANVVTFGAKEALNELGDAFVDAANTEAQKAVDDFWQREEGRQKAMKAFRDALAELIAGPKGADPTPLVIVIDELDRCRPDYALEVLEVIKHFFSVPMVHFVLGVNLIALENSVKARYGQEIDATAYLQKFISLTLTLPDRTGSRHNEVSAVLAYAEYTAKAMGLPERFIEEIVERQLPGILRRNAVSIRDVGKILGGVAILPNEAIKRETLSGWVSIAASMIIARVVRRDVFDKMVAANLSDEELVAYLDARPNIIDRKSANEDFHYPTYYLYRMWTLIASNGTAQVDDIDQIKKQFDPFGDFRSPRNCPKRIFDDWLNTFETP